MVEVEKDPEGWNKDLYEDLSFENLIKSVKKQHHRRVESVV